MGSEWREVRLGELADEITVGHVGPMPAYVEDGIPFLRSQNVDRLHINDSDIKSIGFSSHDRLRKSALHPGDVVIVRTGRPGACAVIPPSLPVANCSDLVIVRCGRELDPWFLAYYVNSAAVHGVSSQIVGAVQQHFNIGSARDLTIRLPDLATQRDVVAILRALDDKIELNRRMSQTLESMARALFKSWFVDFDPVRARSQCVTAGPLSPVLEMFPDSLVGSRVGQIPRGWVAKIIGELADVVGGSTPRTEEPSYWDGGEHYWATPKDLSDISAPVLLSTQRMVTDAGLAQISSGLLPTGTVLLSSRAPIGYLAIAQVPTAINQGFIAMKPRPGVSNHFLHRWAEAKHNEIVSHANGSTFLEIAKSAFRQLPVCAPPTELMGAFDAVASPIHRRTVSIERESLALGSLRDALIPGLMSGRMSPQAQQLEPRP